MAVKINNIDYSGFFFNGEALTAMYLNGNKVYSRGEQTYDPLIDSKYFVVKANSATTLSVNYNNSPTSTIYYKKNGEDNWTIITGNTDVTLSQGDYLEMKGNVNNTSTDYVYFRTTADGNIDVGGCLMALNKNAEITSTSQNQLTNTYAFNKLFEGCTGLVSAEHLTMTNNTTTACYRDMFNGCTSLTTAPSLPATTLATGCYQQMFSGCTSLTSAPVLSATTLANYCYTGMFAGCTSLTTAPDLPASTLQGNCYRDMFKDCTSLTTAPSLPATTLASSCYYGMFSGCTSLTSAPVLSATTLVSSCYREMFKKCTSLTTGPDLLATTLQNYCYQQMFNYCTSLTSLRVGFSTISGSSPLAQWMTGIKTQGVLYAPSDASYSNTDAKLPSTWTLSKTL